MSGFAIFDEIPNSCRFKLIDRREYATQRCLRNLAWKLL